VGGRFGKDAPEIAILCIFSFEVHAFDLRQFVAIEFITFLL